MFSEIVDIQHAVPSTMESENAPNHGKRIPFHHSPNHKNNSSCCRGRHRKAHAASTRLLLFLLLPMIRIPACLSVAPNGNKKHQNTKLRKCWGLGEGGQLGLGDTGSRGDQAFEMGDSLPTVDLGTGASVTSVAVGARHACAVIEEGRVKCWGE